MLLNEMFERSKSDLEGLTDENLCDYYAGYENFLSTVKGISKEECEYYFFIIDLLKANITYQYMIEHGFKRSGKGEDGACLYWVKD